MTRKTLVWILGTLAIGGVAFAAQWPEHPLLDQARKERAERVDYALKNGASVELTPDGKSFQVLWLPEGADPEHLPPMIVTIHGHGSWAFDEIYLWHREAKKRGYGILAVQWWLGKGEKFQDYLIPQEIYRDLDSVLRRGHAAPGSVLFHGFSRGSANSYAVAALDRTSGNDYFGLIVANSGKPSPDFPPNIDVEKGRFGPQPLEGTHWVTFAGGKDTHPDRDGIAGMREAAEWIRRYGGVVDQAIEDENAGHGGFHRDPKNIEAALDIFEQRLDTIGRQRS